MKNKVYILLIFILLAGSSTGRKYVEMPLSDEETADFTNCIKRGAPYGQKEWGIKTAEKLNMQSTIRKRARPRKYPEKC